MLNMASTTEDVYREFPVVVQQAVAWGDMDWMRHVNNVVYFRYFENARLEYFRRLDWFKYQEETGIGPILRDTQGRFRRPLTYPDTISIGARLKTLAEDRFTLEYRLVSETLDDVAATGEVTVVAYDYARQCKTTMPDELRRRIQMLENSRQAQSARVPPLTTDH
jgi:acyl-CoA thioester hydrolase